MKKISTVISVLCLLSIFGFQQLEHGKASQCRGLIMSTDTITPILSYNDSGRDSILNQNYEKRNDVLDEIIITNCGKRPKTMKSVQKVIKGSGMKCLVKPVIHQQHNAKGKPYYVDGIKVGSYGDAGSTNSVINLTGEISNEEKDMTPGQLTASEWNDLHYWSDWEELTMDGVYTSMLDYWQLPMGERESVFVTNQHHVPIPNAIVQLSDHKGTHVWEAMTDHNGKAELWHPISGAKGVSISVEHEGRQVSFSIDQNKKRKSNHLILDDDCPSYAGVDLMFVVDATGSMEDEIAYLKSELADVIQRVTDDNEIGVRTGAVFYKDKWDDYLSAVSDLDEDIEKTLDFMSVQSIGGGGDYPEALDVALGQALEQDWNQAALNRIIFLLLDAPPHDDPEVMERLDDQVRTAAVKGIKLVPITASGIDRETEYLMKQMAMMTNGTYVFLTDDSGIGESHLVHAIPDYNVEQLNALLIRLIRSYGEPVACEVKDDVSVDTQLHVSSPIEVKVFPNPAITDITVEVSEVADKVILHSSSGKVLKQVNTNGRRQIKMDVSNLTGGMYTVSVMLNGISVDRKSLVVVN